MARAYLILIGLTFAAFGLWLLADPDALTRLAGIGMEGPQARNELRAFYGGLEIGIGIFLLGCALRRQRVDFGLGLIACALGGAGLARLASILQDGTEGWRMPAIAAVEIGAAAVALVLLGARPAPAPRA